MEEKGKHSERSASKSHSGQSDNNTSQKRVASLRAGEYPLGTNSEGELGTLG